jgi:DNA-binding SARP family transcriptional activator
MALCLAVLTIATLQTVVDNEFVNFDDGLYVTENPRTQGGLDPENIRWALTAMEPSNWHPLTLWSHMADCELYGLNARGHHLTSLMLHVAAVLALFGLLRYMTGSLWRSGLASALFAIHPLHVESVAWVAERKDVLSALFWFLTMLAYVAFTRRRSLGRYLTILVCFALALMAKSMVVTLPVVLLALDYWPLGRLEWGWSAENRRQLLAAVVEKIPLLAMAAAVSLVTVVAQQGAISSVDVVPMGLRIVNALNSFLVYIAQAVVPVRMAVFYPLHPIPVWSLALAALFFIGMTLLVVRRARSAGYLVTGWFWYVVTLLPVVGILQVGSQARADRYTYIPLVGIFIALAWGAGALVLRRPAWRTAVISVAALWIAVLSVVAHRQATRWSDSVMLFEHALAVTEDNRLAHLNLAEALSDEGNRAALEHYQRAIELEPEGADAYAGLGETLRQWGQGAEAIAPLERAVELAPDDLRMRVSLARSLSAAGRDEAAAAHLDQVLAADPEMAAAHQGRGVLYEQRGELAAALKHFRTALALDPSRIDLVARIERLERMTGEN